MSKLTDILDNFRREQEMKSRCTVAQFAEELNKDVNLVLEQFAEAGIVFSSLEDVVLTEHRERLLDWLKSKHSAKREKRIVIRKDQKNSPFARDWRAVAAGENGAEWECLYQFAGEVIFGQKIHPDQQRLINLIVAKAMIQGALPLKRIGRPKESRTDQLARKASNAYWSLVDSGCSSEDAVRLLSSKLHKTERQIYRYVQSQRTFMWRNKDEREQERSLLRILAGYRDEEPEAFDNQHELALPDLSTLTNEDYLDHLDEMISTEAKDVPDIKDQPLMDSDLED